MDSQPNWSRGIRIPRTPAEWASMAGEVKMPALAENVTDEEYPAGQPVSSLDMHDVGHWESASKVSEAHFLLTRCLWTFSHANSLAKFKVYPDPMVKPYDHETYRPSKKWLSDRQDWQDYLDDIRENMNKRPDPGQAKSLGEFTSTRHWQLCVRDGEKQDNERGNSPTITRSRAKRDLPSVGTKMEVDGSSDALDASAELTNTVSRSSGISYNTAFGDDGSVDRMSGVMKTLSRSSGSSNDPSTRARDAMMDEMPELSMIETKSSISLGELTKKISPQSATGKEEALTMRCRTSDEETVNMALVELLSALTRCCPYVYLEWKADRQSFEVYLGKARLRAKSDGGLFSRHSDVFALVEVKPFVLLAAPETTLRQISLQMVAWIAHAMREPQNRRKAYVFLHCRTHTKSKPFSHTLADTT
ncbi:uncharacterized protein BO96DRAFT_428763 [Aspergillus niger CBS 101883]|uniref:Contig An11c0280, genomic contig n=3 Tax=Aspergillus niger TaxID=5061 RepID=A2QXF0_ASPNC|nr:uncharacterized protein BO96DRAFT_428763 [Aspergillus niger CBS 101883]XP_059604372.1 uncharacterized protein An11g08720 [Aspergillus niger]PYH62027.1 hypothetical protein BO96DRAFT_428763 [Aspergillus niger CBS 101883]RDH17544.1 hypothetical protein M747DRAFT_242765 [Aspergillus niger ATCC 13496]CAK46058.1 unnamed protein product [Aspergillus niger]